MKLSILIIISAPVIADDEKSLPSARFDIWREWQNIQEALHTPEYLNKPITIRRLLPPAKETLEKTLLNKKYDIVHFIGHGNSDGLIFEDKYGKEEFVDIDDLLLIFDKNKPDLLILNACESSYIADKIHADLQIPSIISTEKSILDDAAKLFTEEFYPKLFCRCKYKRSF